MVIYNSAVLFRIWITNKLNTVLGVKPTRYKQLLKGWCAILNKQNVLKVKHYFNAQASWKYNCSSILRTDNTAAAADALFWMATEAPSIYPSEDKTMTFTLSLQWKGRKLTNPRLLAINNQHVDHSEHWKLLRIPFGYGILGVVWGGLPVEMLSIRYNCHCVYEI